MTHIDVHGVRLEVAHIPGDNTRAPLVFLHEGLGSVSLWTQRGQCWPEILCRATGRAGWLYSRRGYGQSDPVDDVRGEPRIEGFWHVGRHEPDYMHREAMDVLPALLAKLGIERPVLVGHSDGATIALLHASAHPVEACAVLAPHVFVEDVSVQAIAQARDAYLKDPDAPGSLRQRLARHHRDVDNAFWQWNDVWLSPAFRGYNIEEECRRIGSPLLLVQGENDEYGTLDQLEAIRRAAPHAGLHALPACGHSPHRDQPEALTRLLQQFVTNPRV
ncbi:alpha/beta fold hydrolase [Hydrogenophaga sp. T2]|uniref:alpha/beta fold hydrolase n=1 Tax=Hydrogenophaga sp. T2 TaxID=3132823 RepID=UPI003CF31463